MRTALVCFVIGFLTLGVLGCNTGPASVSETDAKKIREKQMDAITKQGAGTGGAVEKSAEAAGYPGMEDSSKMSPGGAPGSSTSPGDMQKMYNKKRASQ